MARYNSTVPALVATSANTTLGTPNQGTFTEFTGTSYGVTLPDPVQFQGITQTFYNAASGTITLTAPSPAVFKGPGGSNSSTQSLLTGNTLILASDGTNYIQVFGAGGPISGTSLTATGIVTLNTTTNNQSLTTTGAGTITINSGSTGNIDNIAIGATTASTGRFTTITSTNTTGTAPFVVASTTQVNNLNAALLGGATFASPGSIGSTVAGSGAFTTLSASSTVSGTGFSTYLASPPAIGTTSAAAGAFTTLSASGVLTLSSTVTGSVSPTTNNTYNLGSASLRWSTIYTTDLELSNFIGDYTVVEGEEDLFLYNNKTNKVFKFALIEVDPSQATPKAADLKKLRGEA